jgi:hypothetical protein
MIGSLVLALLISTGLAQAITVHHYTNVTMDSGHLLVAEGTLGAPLIASTGSIGLGLGGSATYPLDDTWRSGTTAVGNANAFDRYWYQIVGATGSATFDLGAQYDQVYIALNQDLGPYPAEALEYRVWVSNDNLTFSELGASTPITMYQGGWSTAGEGDGFSDNNGNGVLNDDYSALWDLPGSYQYVMLTPVDATGAYNEPGIDAIMGMGMSVPEPATMLLFGSLLIGLVGIKKKFKS